MNISKLQVIGTTSTQKIQSNMFRSSERVKSHLYFNSVKPITFRNCKCWTDRKAVVRTFVQVALTSGERSHPVRENSLPCKYGLEEIIASKIAK